MGFESFVFAHNWLLNFHSLFMSMFSDFVHPQNEQKMPFRKFVDFLKNVQNVRKNLKNFLLIFKKSG